MRVSFLELPRYEKPRSGGLTSPGTIRFILEDRTLHALSGPLCCCPIAELKNLAPRAAGDFFKFSTAAVNALGQCLHALSLGVEPRYRDSLLTKLLKPRLESQ